MPPSEPSTADVNAVATALGLDNNPTPPAAPAATPPPVTPPAAPPTTPPATPPAPEPQPPAPPAPAPAEPAAPTDPFAAFGKPTEPAAPPAQPPAEPTPPAQPPADPAQPPATPPTEPATPPVEQPTYQSFDEYMADVLKDVPAVPATPDPDKVNPDDPAAIKGFFDDLLTTVREQVRSETSRSTAIQATERRLWDESFEKYGSLRGNKNLRDMVHSIRMGYFQRGVAITPTQAADKLLESLGQQYKQGVADSAVVSTIENVQPTGGGTGAPVPTNLDQEQVLTDVQTGGETALAAYLDKEVKAGRL